MTTTVHRVDPLEIGDQLKALFMNNDRPEFPEWFDRAYPIAVRDGGRSWVSRDESGRVVAHVAGFPSAMSLSGVRVEGALLCNLLADKEHRTFFPVVATVKRAVRDLREGGAEFIYTNPINPGSVAVMRAAGLRQIGAQNRFFFPTGHRHLPVHLALGVRISVLRLRHRGVVAHRTASVQEAVDWTTREQCGVSDVTARRTTEVYYQRWGDLGDGTYVGYMLRAGGTDVGACIAKIYPVSDEPPAATQITLRCRTLDAVSPCAVAVAGSIRDLGVHRLNAAVLQDTPFAQALVRGGFVRRKEPWIIVAAGYTERGKSVAEGLARADLEKIDVD